MSTVAGSYVLGNGGPATSALLDLPQAVAVDKGGNIYIADGVRHGIRKVTAGGTIDIVSAVSGTDLKFDAAGNIVVIDGVNGAGKISTAGALSLLAGGSTGYNGLSGQATSIAMDGPSGLAIDSQGNIFIADTNNCMIREVTPDGKLQTIAGNRGICAAFGDGGQATAAGLNGPTSIAIDKDGNLYVGEQYRVRKIAGGLISTVAGLGNAVVDGPAAASAVGYNVGLAVDSAGNLYIADGDNNVVRMITNSSNGMVIKTIAGTGKAGFSGDGLAATAAQLNNPTALAFDASGNLYVVDQRNQRIRKIDLPGKISTIAGTGHFSGDNGPATSAMLLHPDSVVVDSAGNAYFSDTDNDRIRRIAPDGTITTIAGSGTCGYSGDGGSATAATLCGPEQLALDPSGVLYVADFFNFAVRKINLSTGIISTYAGTGSYGDTGDGGQASAAKIGYCYGIALDSKGNLYISDQINNRIRKVAKDGTISGFAGSGLLGFSGDGGTATAAKLLFPAQLAVDGNDNVFIADQFNYRIRKVTSAGIIITVAGLTPCCGTGQTATNTYIGMVGGLAADTAGNVYISESRSHYVAKLTPAGSLSLIAGNGTADCTGDGKLASQASLFTPAGLAITSAGDIYLADRYNSRIRKLTLDSPTWIAIGGGDNQSGAAGSTLGVPLTVKVGFRGGVGVPGLPIAFAVTSGTATLSAAISNTDAQGVAAVSVTLGSGSGPIVVTATLSGLTPVQFHLTVGASVPLPTISAGGITGGGGSVPAITSLSPGGFATAYGSNFAPAGTLRSVQGSDLVDGRLPTVLAGVCVQVGGVLAFPTFVSPGQINFQVPAVVVNSTLAVQVITNCGTDAAVPSAGANIATKVATPEFLYWVKNASGQNPIIAVNAVSGVYTGASGLIPGLTFVPAKPGDVLTIYGISFGPTSPAVAPGVASSTVAAVTNTPVSVTMGSSTLPSANVLYAGVSPFTAGLYQLNIQIPANTPDGDYPLVLTMGSFSTPVGPYLTIKN